MICPACGLNFPDDQTGTPREHRAERCRQLMDEGWAQMLPLLRSSMRKDLLERGLTAEIADETVNAVLGGPVNAPR